MRSGVFHIPFKVYTHRTGKNENPEGDVSLCTHRNGSDASMDPMETQGLACCGSVKTGRNVGHQVTRRTRDRLLQKTRNEARIIGL